MKKKSLFLSLLGLGAMLASCSSQGITGVYKFQLGNDKGTHMGLFMTLTNEDVVEPATSSQEAKTLGKKFTLKMDMKGMGGDTEESSAVSSADSSADSGVSGNPITDLIGGDTDFEAYGYYVLGAKNHRGEDVPNRLKLGTTMINDLFGMTGEIPPELVEQILYATLDGNKINVVIPVSLTDLRFQVYWYGTRIEFGASGLEISNSGCQGDIGTHPTKEEIQKIIDHESTVGDETNPYRSFRDYHTLTMGLMK